MEPTVRTPAWEETIKRFPENMRADIDGIWDNHGVLSAEAIARLGIREIETLMIQLLPLAAHYAVTWVSGYKVGAVAAGLPKPGAAPIYIWERTSSLPMPR